LDFLDSSHSQIALNDSQIIMKLTADVEVKRALEARARGYLLKNMPPRELANVIRQVHAGKKRLPPEVT
jgi:DNA-binding NarL/FixJ family response regulator